MDGTSLTPQEIKLQQLKELLPEAFSEGKIDWEKLQLTLGRDINLSNERYLLNWAGKSDAFRALQTPATQTLIPLKEESINFEETENIFIEGENLEVLKVLQRSYFNKVKMIYIDPPYNTGNDSFIYPDKFSETKDDYQKRVGDKDEDGYMTKEGLYHKNSKENGQYHSNWLNMMYPRLFLAKNLLKDDGVIFVSIDDNEVHNLRMLMNEIFGEENLMGQLLWKRRQNADSRNQSNVSTDHEYILVYSKSSLASFVGKEIDKSKYKNPDKDERGPWASIDLSGLATKDQRPNLHYDIVDPETNISYPPNPRRGWSKSKSNVEEMIADGRILFPKLPSGRPREKKFVKDLQKDRTGFSTWLNSKIVGYTTNGTRQVSALMEDKIFDFPKPVALISLFIEQITKTKEEDIVLDFFAGSGTTGQALLDTNAADDGNRKYICVQLQERTSEKSEAFKQGYKTIADLAKERIRRASSKIQNENPDYKGDLGFKVLKLSDSNFKQWRQLDVKDEKAIEKQLDMFVDPVSENAVIENIVYELLLKSGKDLNSKITHKDSLYIINDNELVMMLEQATEETVKTAIKLKPIKVIALDKLFKGNDQLKTNTALQMKDAGIEFKTI
ncbi:site-specific DNA-methyltransferase [Nonlabens marinus]|uniref:site-specific DNA-methyltransferase (adenine-specific) n=1 Tax=Nonlabens marinus S1-08 TaxID=1454201 RepID=W8VR75_9FLAO|nr:site-specific DNA-methyltransferase [Nonlabens marinus]BAO56119.1 type III restriction-modification system methylation subunit [Nonlabens marinus S1-08]